VHRSRISAYVLDCQVEDLATATALAEVTQ